jgi:hypothetical protein
MRKRDSVRRVALQAALLASLVLAAPAFAQEGYPLTGTWSGDWGPSATQRTHLTLVMNWDGHKVSGEINPGPHSIPLASVYLDVTNWTVRIQADTKDNSGNPLHITAEGKLDDLGSIHRKISGTWQEGKIQGDFRVARD